MDQEGQTMLCNSFLNQPMRGTYSTTTDNKTMIGEVWHDFCFSCDLRIGSVVLVKVEKGLEDYNMFLTIDIIEK